MAALATTTTPNSKWFAANHPPHRQPPSCRSYLTSNKGARLLVWWLRTGTNRFTMQLATTRRWRMSTLRSARPYATYGTTFRKELRFRIPSQYSGKQERDRPNNYLVHIYPPTVQGPCVRLTQDKRLEKSWCHLALVLSVLERYSNSQAASAPSLCTLSAARATS